MKQFIIGCAIIFITTLSVSAQRNTYPLSGIKTEYKPAVGNSAFYSCNVQVMVQDTSSISKVHVRMGTTKGGNDLLEKDFTFDQSGTFEDSTSYSRIGKKISLGLGNYVKMDHFYGEVYVVKTDNSQTDGITFGR